MLNNKGRYIPCGRDVSPRRVPSERVAHDAAVAVSRSHIQRTSIRSRNWLAETNAPSASTIISSRCKHNLDRRKLYTRNVKHRDINHERFPRVLRALRNILNSASIGEIIFLALLNNLFYNITVEN